VQNGAPTRNAQHAQTTNSHQPVLYSNVATGQSHNDPVDLEKPYRQAVQAKIIHLPSELLKNKQA